MSILVNKKCPYSRVTKIWTSQVFTVQATSLYVDRELKKSFLLAVSLVTSSINVLSWS